MYLIVYKDEMNTYEVCCGYSSDLFKLLLILEESSKVEQYRVINSDAGLVENLYTDFGWGDAHFTKNSPKGFTWNK